jgi:hypothetical protein
MCVNLQTKIEPRKFNVRYQVKKYTSGVNNLYLHELGVGISESI